MRWPAVAILAIGFGLLAALERACPLRRRVHRTMHRLPANIVLSILAFAAGTLVVRPVALGVVGWSDGQGFGLLRVALLPPAGRVIVGVLLMDLTFYYWHRVNHEVGVLWRFHSVHHVDPDMDVTTTFRFHAGEIAYSAAFRAVQVAVLGVSAATYATYEVLFLAATIFHHSNIRLPIRLERALGRVLVTPRMHGIHHSVVREEVNANYSAVFRWWDALHQTLLLNVPQSAIRIGVAGYLSAADNRIVRLLLMPFWRRKGRQRRASRSKEDRIGPRTRMVE